MNMMHACKIALEVAFTAAFSFFVYVLLCRFRYNAHYARVKEELAQTQKKYNAFLDINRRVTGEKVRLQTELDSIVALYDMTKEICKFLDKTSVYDCFEAYAGRYIEGIRCTLLNAEETPPENREGCVIFPLEVNRKNTGYLVCEGVKEQDKDTFHILAHQLLLGLKRSILYEKVQELAITDSLTRVLSRRYWLERFQEEIERSKKFNYRLSCLMMDVDHFKSCNDRYGHMVGEVILKEVAKIIKDDIRQIDLVGRYGGEEFVVFLAETNRADACFVAERIRRSIEEKHIRAYDEDLSVTISIGISNFPEDARDSQNLLANADEALYDAKNTGRNKVCVWQQEEA